MNVAFYTLGCKVNQYESHAIGESLEKQGYKVVKETDTADVVVINSCTVTAESDRKTRQAVRRFRKKLPNAVIILAGCMPQAFPQSAQALEEADIVTGNTSPEEIPLMLAAFLKTKQRIVNIKNHEKNEKYNTPIISDFGERTRAFMKIEDGCDRYCTYCIIPKARGEIRSKSLSDIEKEAELLSKSGFLEIVLVGINLTSYGKDIGLSICDAVDAAAKPEGIKRVRLGSLELDHITDETLARLKNQKKFCPQFHLALQSGSDATLKRMNRHYDTAFYEDLVNRIRDNFENPSITTDIMVGFAGESEAEFQESVAFLKKIGFARSHVFAYSQRQGTIAAALKNQVEPCQKTKRANLMGEAAKECEAEFLKTQIDRTEEVLFETYKCGIAQGYTENYTRVKAKTDKNPLGQILKVKITDSFDDYCVGEIIKADS